jgi:single-stranded-DNA-specific exonuclease
VFKNRGMNYSETDIEHYLHTSEIDLYPPEIITNMRRGVEMLMKHIKNNDKIFLQIDDDCDGFTSSALFLNYLNCLFPNYV